MNPATDEPADDGYQPPRDPVEIWLARQWQNVLGFGVGIREHFFGLGGNSLDAARVVNAVLTELGRQLPLTALTEHPTVEQLAVLLRGDLERLAGPLVAIQDGDGTRPPLFLVHPDDGRVGSYCRLAHALGEDATVFGLQAAGLYSAAEPARTVAAMADAYAAAVRSVTGGEVGLVGGGAVGAAVAYELAVRLDGVRFVAAIGAEPDPPGSSPELTARAQRVAQANRDAVRGWRPSPYRGLLHVVDRPELTGLPATVVQRRHACGTDERLAGTLRALAG